MTVGEMLKFFGVLILMTRFEFAKRVSLWSMSSKFKYQSAPAFGKTGMSRNRFDDVFSAVRWSEQPDERLSDKTSEQYRWMFVDDCISRFNKERRRSFSPSDLVCVDESMIRWYGLEGFWINLRLPQYMSIDQNPENGCEIQNSACGRSGIMYMLKLVKTKEEEDAHVKEDDKGITHRTKVLLYLVAPLFNSGRIVIAGSYFASVSSCEKLRTVGLRFIGVVKTATKDFPMAELNSMQIMAGRGERRGLLCRGADGNDMQAFVWVDRNRRFFIASASSLQERRPYSRIRWRQISEETIALLERMELTVPQLKAAELYSDACGMIDRHNRSRQDDLDL